MKYKRYTAPVLFIILLIAGYFFWAYTTPKQEVTLPLDLSNNATGTSSAISVPGGTISLEPVPKASSTSLTPDLHRPVIFSLGESVEIQEKIRSKINALIALLQKNPNSFENWNMLALYRNTIGDYEGAEFIWEYLNKTYPGNAISAGNLGFLYGYHLKDPLKAELNYLVAIKSDPSWVRYVQLFEFYRDVSRDKVKATALLDTMSPIFPKEKSEVDTLRNSL